MTISRVARMSDRGVPMVAADIGNTQLKFGLYDDGFSLRRTLELAVDELDALSAWLKPVEVGGASWWIGSVQRSYTTELIDWLRQRRDPAGIVLLTSSDLPLTVELPRPDMVGIDRLLAAVAANRLRDPVRAAVVVDLGTAVTVDRISPAGAFLGGAILPGIGMSARAMHEFTDLLPHLDMTALQQPPPALGTDTQAAMRSGLFWGVIGAVRELIARMDDDEPQIFLTGGAASAVAPLLAQDAIFAPHLTLNGIAATAERLTI